MLQLGRRRAHVDNPNHVSRSCTLACRPPTYLSDKMEDLHGIGGEKGEGAGVQLVIHAQFRCSPARREHGAR